MNIVFISKSHIQMLTKILKKKLVFFMNEAVKKFVGTFDFLFTQPLLSIAYGKALNVRVHSKLEFQCSNSNESMNNFKHSLKMD